jgi:hypothetical protein
MSTVLYTITSRKMMFNGNRDLEARLLYKIFQNN